MKINEETCSAWALVGWRFFFMLFGGLVLRSTQPPLKISTAVAAFIPDDRIVGGIPTTINKHPYQVSFQYYKVHKCGGSIISKTWVLTAAHCLEGFKMEGIKIRSGSTYIDHGGSIHQVMRVIQHPLYEQEAEYDYDAALLQVVEPFIFSDKIRPIPMARKVPATGSIVKVSGWGALANGRYPVQLHKASLKMMKREQCSKNYEEPVTVTDRMICAGVHRGGKDSCAGDSGGPLVAGGKLVGIVSWGPMECGLPGFPGVYTSVSAIYDWVNSVIQE